MSQPKVLGPTVVAGATMTTLPVTGNSVVSIVLVGLAMVAAGVLLIRSSRLRQDAV